LATHRAEQQSHMQTRTESQEFENALSRSKTRLDTVMQEMDGYRADMDAQRKDMEYRMKKAQDALEEKELLVNGLDAEVVKLKTERAETKRILAGKETVIEGHWKEVEAAREIAARYKADSIATAKHHEHQLSSLNQSLADREAAIKKLHGQMTVMREEMANTRIVEKEVEKVVEVQKMIERPVEVLKLELFLDRPVDMARQAGGNAHNQPQTITYLPYEMIMVILGQPLVELVSETRSARFISMCITMDQVKVSQ
jgi:hypothetical protein